MKNLIKLSAVLFSLSAFAASGYQVTGPVVSVDASKIVVQKGKEKWELSKDATTKAPADIKVGDKVTVYYTMAATEIEAKPAKKK